MASDIPEGYELLSGRGSANARRAIELAEERELDSSTILTRTDGYLIPLSAESSVAKDAPSATPVGDPIANISDRQGPPVVLTAEPVDLPTEDNTHAEIDAFVNDPKNNLSYDGIEAENPDKPTKAEKIAHIEKSIPTLGSAESKED